MNTPKALCHTVTGLRAPTPHFGVDMELQVCIRVVYCRRKELVLSKASASGILGSLTIFFELDSHNGEVLESPKLFRGGLWQEGIFEASILELEMFATAVASQKWCMMDVCTIRIVAIAAERKRINQLSWINFRLKQSSLSASLVVLNSRTLSSAEER